MPFSCLFLILPRQASQPCLFQPACRQHAMPFWCASLCIYAASSFHHALSRAHASAIACFLKAIVAVDAAMPRHACFPCTVFHMCACPFSLPALPSCWALHFSRAARRFSAPDILGILELSFIYLFIFLLQLDSGITRIGLECQLFILPFASFSFSFPVREREREGGGRDFPGLLLPGPSGILLFLPSACQVTIFPIRILRIRGSPLRAFLPAFWNPVGIFILI